MHLYLSIQCLSFSHYFTPLSVIYYQNGFHLVQRCSVQTVSQYLYNVQEMWTMSFDVTNILPEPMVMIISVLRTFIAKIHVHKCFNDF